jgi:hypothetical protein
VIRTWTKQFGPDRGRTIVILHAGRHPALGLLPEFLDAGDPRPARDQIDANYRRGGWRPIAGLTMQDDGSLVYPGDPPIQPLYETYLRREIVRLYEASIVAIIQPDGTFEVSRID